MSNVPTTHDELLDESLTAAEQKERVWKRLKESNATTTASESFSSDDSSQRRIWVRKKRASSADQDVFFANLYWITSTNSSILQSIDRSMERF